MNSLEGEAEALREGRVPTPEADLGGVDHADVEEGADEREPEVEGEAEDEGGPIGERERDGPLTVLEEGLDEPGGDDDQNGVRRRRDAPDEREEEQLLVLPEDPEGELGDRPTISQ